MQRHHCDGLLPYQLQAQSRGVRLLDVQHVDPQGLHGHIHTAGIRKVKLDSSHRRIVG